LDRFALVVREHPTVGAAMEACAPKKMADATYTRKLLFRSSRKNSRKPARALSAGDGAGIVGEAPGRGSSRGETRTFDSFLSRNVRRKPEDLSTDGEGAQTGAEKK
jgi:hypothetical protein